MSDHRLAKVKATLPQVGVVRWIGVRAAKGAVVESLQTVEITATGLVGDYYAKAGKRAVTLINAEHLPVIGAFVGEAGPEITPERLRRNLLVSGINLLALEGRRFRVGSALLACTGPCEPCHQMEAELGPGGFNAMAGMGGITARVIEPGTISVGDLVRVEALGESGQG